MADRNYTVAVNVVGDSSAGQRAVRQVGDAAESTSGRIRKAFGSALSTIGPAFGGALDPVLNTFSDIDAGLDQMGDKAKSNAEKIGHVMTGIGAASVGIGGLLSAAGSKDQEALGQLQQAVINSGHSYDDYKGRVESTVSSMTRYGYTANQVYNALQSLTQATGDPTKALNMMGLAANLAAARHEDLQSAVTQLNQILAGKGTKTLQQFGIATVNATKATQSSATAQKEAQTADENLAKAKQHLVDLQNTYANQGRSSIAENAQIEVAQAAVTASLLKLNEAKKKLADLQATDATKSSLTVTQQEALQRATDAVATATQKYQLAQQKVTDLKTIDLAKGQLTITQQINLRTATDAVTTAAGKQAAAHQKAATAETAASAASKAHGEVLGQLANKINGQANRAADSWAGRMRAVKAEVENLVATLGGQFGSAIQAAGVLMTGIGATVSFVTGLLEKHRLKSAQTAQGVEKDSKAMTGAQDKAAASANAEGVSEDRLAASESAAGGAALTESGEEAGLAGSEGAASGAAVLEAGSLASLSLAIAPVVIGIGGLAYGISQLIANDQNVDYGTGNFGILGGPNSGSGNNYSGLSSNLGAAGSLAGVGANIGSGHAIGGPVKAGVGYPVGENGPELFIPDSSGSIVPNRALVPPSSASPSSSRSDGDLHVNLVVDSRVIGKAMIPHFRTAMYQGAKRNSTRLAMA